MAKVNLSENFFSPFNECVYQRVTRKQWQEMLLEEQDKVNIRGNPRRIVAKYLGAGVYELRLKPMEERVPDNAEETT